MGKLLRPKHRFARVAFDAGQLLFRETDSALALGQQLDLLATRLRTRPAHFVRALRQRQPPDRPADRIHLAEHLQATAPRLRQRLPPRLLLLLARADALLQAFQPLHFREVLGPQCLCRLASHVELGLPFGRELGTSRLDRAGLLALGRQAGVPLERLVQPSLGRPLGDFGTGHPRVRAAEPLPGGLDRRDLVGQAGLLLPNCDQSRLQQARDFGGLLADGANLFLAQQISQQRLDLAIAVGVELALAWEANTDVKKVSGLPQMHSTQWVYDSTRPSDTVPSSTRTGRHCPSSSSPSRNASVLRRPLIRMTICDR
ncbi:hypothetical protein X551_01494 [Methylibium sp. T29]|nr:hypothetical protein X551_01494 [Methylibium sp. T29]